MKGQQHGMFTHLLSNCRPPVPSTAQNQVAKHLQINRRPHQTSLQPCLATHISAHEGPARMACSRTCSVAAASLCPSSAQNQVAKHLQINRRPH